MVFLLVPAEFCSAERTTTVPFEAAQGAFTGGADTRLSSLRGGRSIVVKSMDSEPNYLGSNFCSTSHKVCDLEQVILLLCVCFLTYEIGIIGFFLGLNELI